jgi:predicted PurR-regulated permease PerM
MVSSALDDARFGGTSRTPPVPEDADKIAPADGSDAAEASDRTFIVAAIRITCLALLAYWSWLLLQPFLSIIIWSVIFAVALYPVFDWLAGKLGGYRGLVAAAITIFSLVVIFGPVTWLGVSLGDNLRTLYTRLTDGSLTIPPPYEGVKTWPLVGQNVYAVWDLASTNFKALLGEWAAELKVIGGSVLAIAGTAGLDLLKFIIGIVVSGFLFVPGPGLVLAVKNAMRRIATDRTEEFVDLTGATIRNVSRGIIGISALQALLAGIGLLVAGVPAAGLLSFLALLLGIIQVGAWIVLVPVIIWSWFALAKTAAVIFTVYMVPVMLLDNVLRPLISRGLKTPMPVILIGVIGGTLAHGLIGLFVGPIVLSIAWQLLAAWIREGMDQLDTPSAGKRE